MTFRDDRDALHARNEALETELEEAKRALAEKDKELAQARDPRPAAAAPQHRPAISAPQPGATKAHGVQLAMDLISPDASAASAARQALANAPPIVTDAAAGVLARYLRGRGPPARAVCHAFVEDGALKFGGGSYLKLLHAFMKASRSDDLRSAVEPAMQKHVMYGMDSTYVDKKEDWEAANSSTSLVRRLLSVFIRPWVIVVFDMPAAFGIVFMITTPSIAPIVASVLLGFTVLVIAIDSFKRRCPSCRRLLAGKLLSIVKDQYDTVTNSWSCVFCSRRWKT